MISVEHLTTPINSVVKIFVRAEVEQPAPPPELPQTLDDVVGLNIAFKHPNRHLYPGTYVGEVKDYRYCTSNMYPEGRLELLVKSPSFNISKWIEEDLFVCFEWEMPSTVQVILETAVA